MAARERVGLSDAQLNRLREQLAAGRTPRVRVSGPQFADQPTGTVLAIGRPETDGDEFVTVRVKAGGVTDELRFAPRELAAATRQPRRPDNGEQHSPGRPAPGENGTAVQSRPVSKRAASGKKAAPAKPAAPAEDAALGQKAAPKQQSSRAGKGAGTAAQGRSAAGAPSTAAAAGANRRRGAALPTVSVTLTSAGATWSVSAQRGARAVVKNAPVPPGAVSAVAELLGLPALSDAVAAVNDAALREAEARAEALRAELAALEAELDSHRRP